MHEPRDLPIDWWAGIVKIQLPIMTNNPVPEVLIYSEDNEVHLTTPCTDELLRLFQGEKYKVYHHAWLDETGRLNIGGIAPEQDW